MVVAIDGPAGSGKSTIARGVAERLGIAFLNSGQMYRSITFKAQAEGRVADPVRLVELAESTHWTLDETQLSIDGQSPWPGLHSDAVDQSVSAVSSVPAVREAINRAIRTIALNHDLVVEGRDMCSVVFPDTPYKYYIDASPEARAQRRFTQGGSSLSYGEMLQAIRNRDAADQSKAIGALLIMPDAHYIDSSGLTIDEVCATVLQSIQGKFVTVPGATNRNEH